MNHFFFFHILLYTCWWQFSVRSVHKSTLKNCIVIYRWKVLIYSKFRRILIIFLTNFRVVFDNSVQMHIIFFFCRRQETIASQIIALCFTYRLSTKSFIIKQRHICPFNWFFNVRLNFQLFSFLTVLGITSFVELKSGFLARKLRFS